MKPYLILYDIASNKIRNRVAREILRAGLYRIQKSVFLGVSPPAEIQRLQTLFQEHIHKSGSPTDSYLIIPLTAYNIDELIHLVPEGTPFDLDLWLNRKTVVFI